MNNRARGGWTHGGQASDKKEHDRVVINKEGEASDNK